MHNYFKNMEKGNASLNFRLKKKKTKIFFLEEIKYDSFNFHFYFFCWCSCEISCGNTSSAVG